MTGFDWTKIPWGQSDSGDEGEAIYPKPDSEKLNSPVKAETPEERERLWNLIVQASRG
jgi:hypothetical protein